MNIYIMVDMEGISGITNPEQVSTMDGKYYSEGRRYMTWDVNACVEGCKAAGVDKIIVRDAHSGGKNLIWEELSPNAEYIVGNTRDKRMPGIEECDGVILLGYHAMAGTPGAVLEHTMSSKSWQNFWINGMLAGELAIDAGIAGDYNKPVIMVSGDDKVCEEAKRLIPDVVTAEVKKGINLTGARMLSKESAHKLIFEKTKEAVGKLVSIKPYKVEAPIVMRLELVERGKVPSTLGRPHIKVIDGRTFETGGNTFEETFNRLIK